MMPKIHDEVLTENDFMESVQYLITSHYAASTITRLPVIDRILAYKACHSAIRFGEYLTYDECCRLVAELAETDMPFQCAHGRPSIIPLATVV